MTCCCPTLSCETSSGIVDCSPRLTPTYSSHGAEAHEKRPSEPSCSFEFACESAKLVGAWPPPLWRGDCWPRRPLP
eukprot:6198415-Pleurochrysis_carterae.AAC.2